MTKEEIKILGEIFSRISEKTYEELGAEFKLEKEKKLELEKKFSLDLSIEERAKLDNKYIDETAKEEILYIISCLKDPIYSFIKDDIDKLTTFISKLNFILRGTSPSGKGMADRMNNIKDGLIKEGKLLELDVLFNEFKKATSWKLFKANTSIDSAFFSKNDEWKYVYLFSNCKNCQDKINYPLYYAAWQVIADWCFKVKTGDYDAFCEYYRKLDFLGNEKQLNFSCYYELLRVELRNNSDFTKFLGALEENKRKEILEEIRETEVKDNELLPIVEYNIEEQIIAIEEKFKKYLEIVVPNSAKKYLSGKTFVNKVVERIGLDNFFLWTSEIASENANILFEDEEFKSQNSKGNNMYSAMVNHFIKFLNENMETEDVEISIVTPIMKLTDYKWNWATSTPQEGLNDPKIILGVLRAIDECKNENPGTLYTQSFKEKLKILETELGLKSGRSPFPLSKEENEVNRNIIASNKGYWSGIGLIDSNNDLTELGKEYAEGAIDRTEFAVRVINELLLPNPNIDPPYNSAIVKNWQENGLEIHPLKLIIQILSLIQQKYNLSTQPFITFWEFVDIIVPIAADTPSNLDKYCKSIIAFRNSEIDVNSWPKYYPSPISSGESKPTEIRHYYEYLLFLINYGILETVVTGNTKYDANFYLTPSARRLFKVQSNHSSTNPENKDPNCKSLIKPEFKENKIFFGAPGTGKSTRITQILEKEKVCEKFVTRVTFHPEYDYASFVGGYKPFTDLKGEIKYAFVPQTFTNVFIDACNNPDSQYYLIIEEINRGNCAEIFGDLFQLLDRNPKYPITTSKELREYLSGVDSNGEKRIKVATEYWDRENGKMRLPNNITLWATMNTSDQSLMPMDSAFKRRWEWQYIPIIYTAKDPETNKDNTSFKYKVQFGKPTKTFSWIEFIKEINNKISKIDSLGMDKCLGNYFVQVEKNKQDEYLISEDTFINKVLFYLWNDVFKDENDEDGISIFKGITFMDFFPKETARVNIKKILNELSIKIDGDQNNELTESINEVENQESDFKITETKTEE
jgi:hypothetical protein